MSDDRFLRLESRRAIYRRFSPLFWLCLALAIPVVGCAVHPYAPPANPHGAQATTRLDTIADEAADASNHLSAISVITHSATAATPAAQTTITQVVQAVTPHVQAATADVAHIQASVPPIKQDVTALEQDRDKLAQEYNGANAATEKAKAEFTAYKKAHANDWLGPRAHKYLRWIIILGSLFGLGLFSLDVAGTIEGGATAGAMVIAGHILTAGVSLLWSYLVKFAAWACGYVKTFGSWIVSLLEKASPNPVAPTKTSATA